MLRFVRRLFCSSVLDPANLGERARDVVFREMKEADIPTCLGFYRGNEAAHFPPGRFEYYAEELRERAFLTLIATRENRPVGCCGIQLGANGAATFCFGMVDPAFQRQGIGTAQVLVRIALLDPVNDLAVAGLLAVPGSVSFYKRFGFVFMREVPGEDGGIYQLGVIMVSRSFVEDCRNVLAERNITYPDVRDKIPKEPRLNSAAPGDGATALLFSVERLGGAVPEPGRSAKTSRAIVIIAKVSALWPNI